MTETFRKISNIKFNGKQLYYKTNHVSVMVPATEFTNTSHILYFYKKEVNDTQINTLNTIFYSRIIKRRFLSLMILALII